MKKRAFIQSFYVATIIVVLGFSQVFAASNRDRILSEISVSKEERYSVIKISFNFPIRYIRHYPLSYGKEVRIQFEAIQTSPDDQEGLQDRESLFPPKNNPAGVVRVEYEGNDLIDPTITVVFEKPTSYEANQGEDFRSLRILVPLEEVEDTLPAPPAPKKKPVAEDKQIPKETADPPARALAPERQEALIKEGEEVMAQKNYPRAIQVYTKLQESSDPEIQELAQFQLALAREYNGHLAHAKAEYRNYLRTYPEGPNAGMAHDRLKALLSARPLRSPGSPESVASEESLWESDFYGSISEFYDIDESFAENDEDDEGEETINFQTLTTSFDATWRLRSDNYRVESVFIGSHEADLQGDQGDDTRVSRLYVDFEDSDRIFTSRLGRQSASSGGVLGRYDGGEFSYLFTEKARLNLVAGFPVDFSSDGLETDKYFYGINFDLGRFADHWDFNVFFINQIADSITDRRAIGGEVRYVGSRGSIFTLIDYDILFNELNTVLFAGNWLMPNNSTRLNISADFRNSPILTTSNALIGQLTPSLEALEDSIGESALRQLAEDRTLDSSFVTVGVSHPITDNIQIAGDVSWSKLDGGPASGGVEAIESTGDDFFYSAQLIGSNLIKNGDISTLGLRYSDTQRRDTYTMTLNSRYPITDAWRINPRLQIDYRENKILSGDQWRFQPSLRVEYLLWKQLRFEVEGGYSYANQELEGVAEDTEGYFVSLGVRWDF